MSSRLSNRYPAPIAIHQRDVLALTRDEQDHELSSFEMRLQNWAGRVASFDHGEETTTVSVEVPVFKGGWIMPAIESVLYQTSTAWKLAIRWDGGDDLSRRILEAVHRLSHPQIQVHFGENRGIAYNRRFLTEHSTGDYILPLDDDDMLAPDAVETFLDFVRRKPWSGIVRARRDFIDEVGNPVHADPWFPFEPRHYQFGMVRDVSNHCQPMLISRAAYAKTGGWAGFEEFRFAGEDCDIFLKIEEVAPIELLDTILYYYRLSDRRTSLVITDGAAYEMWRRLADRTIARIGLPVERTNDRPPFSYERRRRSQPSLEAVDFVVFEPAADSDEDAPASGAEGTIQSLRACAIADDAIHVVSRPTCGADARNEGFRRTSRPIVCFVRAGIDLHRDALTELVRHLHDGDADIAAPRLVWPDGAVACAAPAFNEHRLPIWRGMGAPHRKRYESVADAAWLPSACLLVRREVMNAVGGFEGGSCDVVADADFCLKARKRDFRTVYVGPVVVVDRWQPVTPSTRDNDLEWLAAKWRDQAHLCDPLDFGPEMSDHKVLYERGNTLMRDGHLDMAIGAFRSVVTIESGFSWGYHSLGDALFQAGRWAEAAEAYREAIARNSDVFWSHLHLGNTLSKLERWDEALAAYGRAIELDANIASAHSSCGRALLTQARWRDALSAFERAAALDGEDFWSHYGRGDALSGVERWAEAVSAYERAISLRSDVSWAHHHLGDGLAQLGRLDEAAAAYRRALAIEPSAAATLTKLGNVTFRLDQFSDAVALYDRAIEIEPGSFWAQYGRGDALSGLERWEEAVRAYDRAIALKPDSSWAHHHLGDGLAQLGRLEEAAGAYRRALEIDSTVASTHSELGNVLFRLDQFREAVAVYDRAIELDSNSFWAHYGRGDALSSPSLERWAEAIDSYERANTIRPNQFWSYYNLGQAHGRLKRWHQAAQAFKRATDIDPDNARVYWKLGGSLTELRDFEGAVLALRRAVALEPGEASSYGSLGNALFEIGRWDEAAAAYRQAIALEPEVAWYRTNLGHTLLRHERFDDAAEIYRTAIGLQRDEPERHADLGQALSKAERWAEAAASYERAIELDPRPFWCHHNLGYALLRLARWEDAATVLERAIAIDSGFCWSHHYLGNALAKLDRWPEAADAFRRAIDLEPTVYWSANCLGEMLAKLQRWDEAREAFERALALQPDFYLAAHNLADAFLNLGRLDEAAEWYRRAGNAFPAWCRADTGRHVRMLERWIERLSHAVTSTGADARDERLLFVFDTDYGELTTAMYMLLGQPLAANSTLLLPPRLFVNNSDILPGRTCLYRSTEDILQAVERHRPDVVFIASGYLFSIHDICSPEMLQDLVERLAARGCQIVTTDPFLGLLANLGTTTHISIDIPADASPLEVRLKREQDVKLVEHFSKAVEILRDVDHLYPVYPAGPGEAPPANGIRRLSAFNDELILDNAVANGEFPDGAPVRACTDTGKPLWVFVLASRDYELQAAFLGKTGFAELLVGKLEQTLAAGRHPVLIAPYSCVRAVIEHVEKRGVPIAEAVTLTTFCAFKRFSALLLSAEYVFYWNALSHSMFLRLFNERPTFLFNRGHLVRNVTPLYERIVGWYYQGWEPVYLDVRQALTLEGLAEPAEVYRAGARQIRGSLRRAPSPVRMLDELRRSRPADDVPVTA